MRSKSPSIKMVYFSLKIFLKACKKIPGNCIYLKKICNFYLKYALSLTFTFYKIHRAIAKFQIIDSFFKKRIHWVFNYTVFLFSNLGHFYWLCFKSVLILLYFKMLSVYVLTICNSNNLIGCTVFISYFVS